MSKRIIGIIMLALAAGLVADYFLTIMVLVSGWKVTVAWWGSTALLWIWGYVGFRLVFSVSRSDETGAGEGKP
jgi:hypothetical protein